MDKRLSCGPPGEDELDEFPPLPKEHRHGRSKVAMSLMHRKARLIPVLAIVLSWTALTRGEIRSIKDHAIPLPDETSFLQTKMALQFIPRRRCCDGDQFIARLGEALSKVPFPTLLWSDPAWRKRRSVSTRDDESLGTFLDRMTSSAGPYQAREHQGFLEVAWTKDSSASLRDQVEHYLPPISMHAQLSAQLLTVWHRVSAMDFDYDSNVVDAAMDFDRSFEKEMLDTVRTLQIDQIIGKSMEFRHSLTTSQSTSLDEFMATLAASIGGSARLVNGRWILVPFERDEAGLERIRKHIARFREGNYRGSGYWLARMGVNALPEILAEFEKAEEHDLLELTDLLSLIPAPERDRAFLSRLSTFMKKRSEVHDYGFVSTILLTLADNGNAAAIPLMEQIASEPAFDHDVRATANVSLNRLGASPEPRPIEKLLDLESGSTGDIELLPNLTPILHALFDQCFAPAPTEARLLSVPRFNSLDTGQDGRTVIRGVSEGAPPFPKIQWTVRILEIGRDDALVEAEFDCGDLCGSGFRGRFGRRDGRWLVMAWEHLWSR